MRSFGSITKLTSNKIVGKKFCVVDSDVLSFLCSRVHEWVIRPACLFVEGSWQLQMQELKSLIACKVSFIHLNLQRQLHSKKTSVFQIPGSHVCSLSSLSWFNATFIFTQVSCLPTTAWWATSRRYVDSY